MCNVPQSLQKPLRALEKRGNPWGKMERKRADWTQLEEFSQACPVKDFSRKETAETLYFVDSVSSFDDRMQQIAELMAVGRETIKSRLRYAMKQLRQLMADCL